MLTSHSIRWYGRTLKSGYCRHDLEVLNILNRRVGGKLL